MLGGAPLTDYTHDLVSVDDQLLAYFVRTARNEPRPTLLSRDNSLWKDHEAISLLASKYQRELILSAHVEIFQVLEENISHRGRMKMNASSGARLVFEAVSRGRTS